MTLLKFVQKIFSAFVFCSLLLAGTGADAQECAREIEFQSYEQHDSYRSIPALRLKLPSLPENSCARATRESPLSTNWKRPYLAGALIAESQVLNIKECQALPKLHCFPLPQ
jgi:hypothetical protein